MLIVVKNFIGKALSSVKGEKLGNQKACCAKSFPLYASPSCSDIKIYTRTFLDHVGGPTFFTHFELRFIFLFPLFVSHLGGSKLDIGIVMGVFSLFFRFSPGPGFRP